MHKILATIISISITTFGFSSKATMRVALDGEFLSIKSQFDGSHTIHYEFSRCMANHIYTFNRVIVDSSIVNEATSDNIGPFLIEGCGWTGGNHLLPDGKTPSARTNKVQILIDGTIKRRYHGTASRIDIYAANTLLVPTNPSLCFCQEYVHYIICGNSIQVSVNHKFLNRQPLVISRYYGMQSMMKNETEVLTPNGAYQYWTPIDSIDRFTFQSAPKFRQFIEKSSVCYAASYLTEKGLGDHHLISPEDVVFIGNSWSKSYHKLIGNVTVRYGDSTHWEGIYTWFINPETDDGNNFSYKGYYNGKKVIFNHSQSYCDKIISINK